MKNILISVIFVAALLCLTACGGGAPATSAEAAESVSEAPVITPVPTPEPTPVPTPTPEPDPVLPDGTVLTVDVTEIDLSELRHSEVDACCDALSKAKAVSFVDLGTEREPEDDDALSWEDVRKIQDAAGEADVLYRFNLFGKDFTTLDEQMIISHRKMDDQGEAVREVLPCMTKCTFLDMDSCGVDNEHMAAIRDDFPDIKVVWRVWFGGLYSCRTNVTTILASLARIDENGEKKEDVINNSNCEGLYYCTDVVYLDIGHNAITDFSFLYNMPNVEVLIIACSIWRDCTPVGSLEKLEYLEFNRTYCEDVTPLANLKNLKHLNVGTCYFLKDLTPLYGLTQLERLWVGTITPAPQEQKEELVKRLPDTEVNITTDYHKGQGWTGLYPNWVPRYALLREQFQYDKGRYSTSYNDILAKKSLDELTPEEMEKVWPSVYEVSK